METDRTILYFLSQADLPEVLEMYAEPDTFRYIEPAQNKSNEEYTDFLESRIAQVSIGIGYHWVVRTKETKEFIGLMNLNPMADRVRIQVGFQLRRKFWRQGLATELTKAVLDFGFEEAEIGVIYAMFNTENIASARIFRKFGFEFVEQKQIAGETMPVEIWKCEREKWKFNKSRFNLS